MTHLTASGTGDRSGESLFATKYERALFTILFFGFCTLFLGLDVKTPLVVLKPFDIVCLICTPILILSAFMKGRVCYSTGFGFVLLFLAVNVLLAFPISPKNGVREAIQATELAMFSYVLILYARQIDWRKMARFFVAISVLITLFNAYWHISNGFYFGWKRLDEPKLLFSYAVPVIFSLMLCTNRQAGQLDYLVVAVIAMLLIVSGERKAQLAYLLHLFLMVGVAYFRFSVLAAFALITAPLAAALVLSDEYLTRQLLSVFDLQQLEAFTLTEMATGEVGITQSNSQRIFAGQLTGDLVQNNPFFGLGTNGYIVYVQDQFQWLPNFFLTGIHNEFQRILVENGLVGLALYMAPWARSFFLIGVVYKKLGSRGAAIYAMFWITFFIQCFFEGSGNEAFLAFVFVALLPELFLSAVSPTTAKAASLDTGFTVFKSVR
ncbi:MAG: O-antigen ligase family protein [Pseudomonadota bacterium]